MQQSDEFDGTSLDGKWDVIRDSGDWSVADGGLQVPISSGSLYGPGGNAEDIIVQDAPDGACEVTAKVSADVTENYQQAGLRVYSDDENWASVHLISAGGTRDVEFIYEAAGSARNNAEDKLGGVPAGFPSTYYVRLTSDGTDLRASYSTDGETFSPVGRPAPMSTLRRRRGSARPRSPAWSRRPARRRPSTGSGSSRTARAARPTRPTSSPDQGWTSAGGTRSCARTRPPTRWRTGA